MSDHIAHNVAIAAGEIPVEYEPWRHGGWYTNVRYPSGACGCVARAAGGKWTIACDGRSGEPIIYPTREAAARAEAVLVATRGDVRDALPAYTRAMAAEFTA